MESPLSPAVASEGRLRIDEDGHHVYFWRYGEGPETIVGLHGGPGMDSRYIRRYSELAGGDFEVVLYDQLGSGKADRPDDPSLWQIDRFVKELEAVRVLLKLGKIHLVGHSWGGMLALQYALDYPNRLSSLVLSHIAPSTAQILQGMDMLRSRIDPRRYTTMKQSENERDWTNDEYIAAVIEVWATHFRRSTPFDLDTSINEFKAIILPLLEDIGPAYREMWGPNDFVLTGNLQSWDLTNRLHELHLPTLVVSSWHDEVLPELARQMAESIEGSEFIVFGRSSHMVMLEHEAEAYLGVLRNFVERQARAIRS